MDQIQIGKFISECRRELKLTQADMAEQLGVSNRAVSKWETGKCMPDASLLLGLCNILKISANELLCGRRLNEEEQKLEAEKSTVAYLVTKDELQNMLILTEILICAGIAIACTLASVVAETLAQKIITLVCGCFVWGFGIWMRVRVYKALRTLDL